jgi:hypothetical protein
MFFKKIVSLSVIPVIIFIVYFFSDNATESLTNTKVLFIGNSYTYRNNMPHIFEEISKSKGKKVEVEHCTLGKATLYIQSKRPKVFQYIRRQNWDVIVIQGSSRDFLADSSTLADTTKPALEKLIKAVQRHNPATKMLFYMTWGYKNGYKPIEEVNSFEKMADKIRDQYLSLYKTYNIGVVPVGMAWKDVRRDRADVKLYVKDGAHPSLKGSYLAASCFYAAIFGESPIGATYYSKLGPKICAYLQERATRNVLYQQKTYGLPVMQEVTRKQF